MRLAGLPVPPSLLPSGQKLKNEGFERRLVLFSRLMTAAAVLGSLAGALLMFALGVANVYQAYAVWLPGLGPVDITVSRSATAMIFVIEALDRFLIAIVLLYFGYGVYSLFIRSETSDRDLALPALLHVRQIGQLKQVVAEVIIVILFVLFLKSALQGFQEPGNTMTWQQIATMLVLPVCAALLGLALRLVELHPKPPRPTTIMTTGKSGQFGREPDDDDDGQSGR